MREAIFRIKCDRCHTELEIEDTIVTAIALNKGSADVDLCQNCLYEVNEFLSFVPFGAGTCPDCGRTFSTAQGLGMHRYKKHGHRAKVKTAKGPFVCEVCDKSFPTAQQRGTHKWSAHRMKKESA